MSRDTVVMAQLEVEGCVAELYVNGVPTSRLVPEPGRLPVENVAVEQLLVPGDNVLELLVEPGGRPSEARTRQVEQRFRPMRATGRLVRFREGDDTAPGDGETLLEVAFKWSDASVDRRILPTSSAQSVALGAAHGRWAWQDAPELVMDDALVAEACALLDRVDLAVRTANADRLYALSEAQLRDVLHAYPTLSSVFLRDDLASMLQHYQKGPDPVVARDPAKHDFRLVGGGRLLQLVEEDWTPSFKLRDPVDRSEIGYPMFLARLGPELRIVR